MKKVIWIILAVAGFAMPVQAAAIRNLSGEAQALTILQGGERETVQIEDGRTYRRVGANMILELAGNAPVRVDDPHQEYVIWPDGKLIIQRRGLDVRSQP